MGKSTVATIYDVAEMARVSMATVSRVLNNPNKVNLKTREKVLKVVNELGYKPNPIARVLATKKSTTIGVVVSDITKEFVPEIISGVLDAADDLNYSIKLFSLNEKKTFNEFVNNIISEKLEGVILLNDNLDEERISIMKEKITSSNVLFVMTNVTSSNIVSSYKNGVEAMQSMIESI